MRKLFIGSFVLSAFPVWASCPPEASSKLLELRKQEIVNESYASSILSLKNEMSKKFEQDKIQIKQSHHEIQEILKVNEENWIRLQIKISNILVTPGNEECK